MTLIRAFEPSYGSGQTITVTSTPQSYTFLGDTDWTALELTVFGTQPVYYRVTPNSVTTDATIADGVALPNSQKTVYRNREFDRISVWAPAAGSIIHIIAGQGL